MSGDLRPILGFEDYAVDADANVWRIKPQTTGRRWKNLPVPYKLTARPAAKTRYLCVTLTRDGKHYRKSVHRLVCEVFHGPSLGREVAHGDGSRDNNRPENLRWATNAENLEDRKRHGTDRAGESLPGSKLSDFAVRVIRKFPKKYGVYTELSKTFGVGRGVIREASLGITWAHVT